MEIGMEYSQRICIGKKNKRPCISVSVELYTLYTVFLSYVVSVHRFTGFDKKIPHNIFQKFKNKNYFRIYSYNLFFILNFLLGSLRKYLI